MFLYPAKSVSKYQIYDKEVIIIGEYHHSLSDEYNKDNNSKLTAEFLYNNLVNDSNTSVYLEIDPVEDIHKRIEYYSYMEIHSKNLMDFINEIKKHKNGKKLAERIYGSDYRRIHPLFGQFHKIKLQDKFFNNLFSGIKLKDLITILNFVMFEIINWRKVNWGGFGDIIPNVIRNLEEYFQYYDSQYNTFTNILNIDSEIELININNYQIFAGRLMHFLADFSDFFMLRDIIKRDEKKVMVLVGEKHAESLNKMLSRNIIYPPQNINDISINIKQKLGKAIKFLGKEMPKNSEKVLIRYL
jgi:hypothetical protein